MMTSNPTNASNPENDLENDLDRISNLPDPILELILSGIPATEEVIRTSILSKRWRYLWTLIPSFSSLDIHCSRGRPTPPPEFDKKKFKQFVSLALQNKSHLDLESFRLCCSSFYSLSTVKKWIQAAVKRNVKLLDLMFCPKYYWEGIVFHRCLETSDSLESLRLDVFGHALCLHSCACARFTALKVLELNKVYCFDHNLIEQFFKNSPILEDLSLIDCYMNNIDPLCISSLNLKTLRVHNCKTFEGFCGLKVSCPKMVVLEYVNCPRARLFSENLDSLKNAVILPQDNLEKKVSSYLGNNVCKLLAEISHVESLSLNLYFIQAIDAGQRNFPASLPNLKTLALTTTIDAFTMNLILYVIILSPSLESLNLIIQEECITPEYYWDLYKVGRRRILTRHLKRVEFLEFNGEKRKLDIARLLLEHGNALEEMVFTWSDKVKYHEKSTETINQVSKFPKASSAVKLIALLKIPQDLFNYGPGPGPGPDWSTVQFSYNSY